MEATRPVRNQGLGFRVWGLGFRVQGLGFRVPSRFERFWGFGFARVRAPNPKPPQRAQDGAASFCCCFSFLCDVCSRSTKRTQGHYCKLGLQCLGFFRFRGGFGVYLEIHGYLQVRLSVEKYGNKTNNPLTTTHETPSMCLDFCDELGNFCHGAFCMF